MDGRAERQKTLLIIVGVCAFCVFYGFAFALFAPRLLLPLISPLPLLAFIGIWALPETRTAPTRTQVWLFYAFFVGLIIWPNYIAFAPPGLPWITMVRITGFPLVLVLLICVSVSEKYRRTLSDTLSATPLIWKSVVAFVVLQAISIGLSKQPGGAIDKFIVAQVSWTAIFFVSSFVFLKPGRAEGMVGLLWFLAIPVGLIGIFEWRVAHILWVDHIPKFLRIPDPAVQNTLSAHVRAADGTYRTQSTFSTSLGLGEYLALTFPFVIHFAIGSYKIVIRALAVLSLPFMIFIVYITNSRLAVIGCMMSFVLYAGAWTVMLWRRDRQSIIAPAIFAFGIPTGLATLVTMFFTWKHFHDAILGGGAAQPSTEARKQQLATALPKIFEHPWGYGIGQGASTVGFVSPTGVLTLDSYYLTIAIEYGLFGFILYFGIFIISGFTAAKYTLKSVHMAREYSLLIPLAIALANFVVIKSVFSQQDNHAIVFMFLGMIVALAARVDDDQSRLGRMAQPV